ncbi:MAG TPA: AAA family ATPase [Candidatus Methanoperedens sp.]
MKYDQSLRDSEQHIVKTLKQGSGLESNTVQRNAKIISFINLKGGVGKTTLCLTIGEFLSFAMGKKVLLIDLDSQSNLTSSIVSEPVFNEYREKGSIYHLFKGLLDKEFAGWNLEHAIVPPTKCSNIEQNTYLSAILSFPDLGQFDEDLADKLEECFEKKYENNIKIKVGNWRKLLKDRLEPLRSQYDYILIDCPPSLSLFTSNALVASDYYVTPIVPEYLSIKGLELIQKRLGYLMKRKGLNDMKVDFAGCIINRIDIRRKDHKKLCENDIYANKGKFKPFKYWIGDHKPMYIVTDYLFPLNTLGYYGRKWNSVLEKYNFEDREYRNPSGILHIPDEGDVYNLYNRLYHLTTEFIGRCR